MRYGKIMDFMHGRDFAARDISYRLAETSNHVIYEEPEALLGCPPRHFVKTGGEGSSVLLAHWPRSPIPLPPRKSEE